MSYTLKIINVFLISTVRYFYTPIFALLIKLDLTTSVITMIAGGVISFIVYYHLARLLLLLGIAALNLFHLISYLIIIFL